MDTREKIIEKLKNELAPVSLNVIDNSKYHANHAEAKLSGGGHFKVEIVSSKFENLTRVQRHQAIYKILGELMDGEIHAVQISALTETEVTS